MYTPCPEIGLSVTNNGLRRTGQCVLVWWYAGGVEHDNPNPPGTLLGRPPGAVSAAPWDAGAGGLSYASLLEEARQLTAAKAAVTKAEEAGHKHKKSKKEKKEKKDKKERKVGENHEWGKTRKEFGVYNKLAGGYGCG